MGNYGALRDGQNNILSKQWGELIVDDAEE
jgi:hypothetical protein